MHSVEVTYVGFLWFPCQGVDMGGLRIEFIVNHRPSFHHFMLMAGRLFSVGVLEDDFSFAIHASMVGEFVDIRSVFM
jgi:hypothetical protein